MAKKSENIVFCGTGRRKKSIARVRLVEGKGDITVNGKPLDEYFGTEILKVIVNQPLTVTNTVGKYDVVCKVVGGGYTGQAGAIRHGISRALLEANGEYRAALKSNGFLTRDPRMKLLYNMIYIIRIVIYQQQMSQNFRKLNYHNTIFPYQNPFYF